MEKQFSSSRLAQYITADALQRLPPRPRRFGLEGTPLREKAVVAYENQLYDAAHVRPPTRTPLHFGSSLRTSGFSQAHTRQIAGRSSQRKARVFVVSVVSSKPPS